jgi:hypothetical protein
MARTVGAVRCQQRTSSGGAVCSLGCFKLNWLTNVLQDVLPLYGMVTPSKTDPLVAFMAHTLWHVMILYEHSSA